MKEKVIKRAALPEDIVNWINEQFTDANLRNVAYLYALAAHIQVQKMPQRKIYDYICLPKKTLRKHIKSKALNKVKKVFADSGIVYKQGWKKTSDGNYMNKYSFNEAMFLSRLVKVEYYIYKPLPTPPKITTTPPPRGVEGVYMGRILDAGGQSTNDSITIKHRTMKKEISYNEVIRLKSQGFTHEQIAEKMECSTKKIQRVLNANRVDKVDNAPSNVRPTNDQVDSATISPKQQVDNERAGNGLTSKPVDNGRVNLEQQADSSTAGDGHSLNPTDNKISGSSSKTPLDEMQLLKVQRLETFPKIRRTQFSAQEVIDFTVKNLKELEIDLPKLRELIPNHIQSSINQVNIVESTRPNIITAYKYQGGTKTYRNWTHKIIEGLKPGQILINYKNDYIVGDFETFKAQKRNDIETNLLRSLQAISNPDCYSAKINSTNGRLDSPLTNLWGGFKEQILVDNGCAEIDIINSQMAFMSGDLKKTCPAEWNRFPEYYSFLDSARDGSLYNEAAKKMHVTRESAKNILMHVLFCSHKARTDAISVFQSHYQYIMQYANSFKKEYGDKMLAIRLQILESEFMIKGVLNRLKNENIFAITVHDSVICRSEDVETIKEIITQLGKDNDFYCALRTTYPKAVESVPVTEKESLDYVSSFIEIVDSTQGEKKKSNEGEVSLKFQPGANPSPIIFKMEEVESVGIKLENPKAEKLDKRDFFIAPIKEIDSMIEPIEDNIPMLCSDELEMKNPDDELADEDYEKIERSEEYWYREEQRQLFGYGNLDEVDNEGSDEEKESKEEFCDEEEPE